MFGSRRPSGATPEERLKAKQDGDLGTDGNPHDEPYQAPKELPPALNGHDPFGADTDAPS